jgi:hypothetical protein
VAEKCGKAGPTEKWLDKMLVVFYLSEKCYWSLGIAIPNSRIESPQYSKLSTICEDFEWFCHHGWEESENTNAQHDH